MEAEATRARAERKENRKGGQQNEGKNAKRKAQKGASRKALMSLTPGGGGGTPAERSEWTARLIPNSARIDVKPIDKERGWAASNAAGANLDEIYKYLAIKNPETGFTHIPLPSFPALSAPGPSGERGEHLEQAACCPHVSMRKRFRKALDAMTLLAAQGNLPDEAAWILNTAVTYLDKTKTQNMDEDEEWLWQLTNTPINGVTEYEVKQEKWIGVTPTAAAGATPTRILS